ncbi:MAG: SDR family oxidoreductase [Rubrobacteraceae bacterium]
MTSRVLVTGANGFVGRVLCPAMERTGLIVRKAVRNGGESRDVGLGETSDVGHIGPDTDWMAALDGVDTVVHLAGRVHVLRETFPDPQEEFHNINVLGTERLARSAADAGVRRLVYVSSVGVNGRSTPHQAFTEKHAPSPHNLYALSKWEAEKSLHRIAEQRGLEVVILRPPLIYGPGVKANFLRLMELVDRGLPLPFDSVHNRRSLLYVGNLCDLIIGCLEEPRVAGGTFLVSDGEDVSTPDLVRHISRALDDKPRLLPFPPRLIRIAARLTWKHSLVEPLLDSLVVDSSRVRDLLGWEPPYTLERGLRETAKWFENRRS